MNPTQPLDPSIVHLAQAISKAETGGSASPYTQAGQSGEYGAYQYTAPTWAADSQKYLGQAVPLDQATPAQQDEVAYNKIKSLGEQGYTPAQIASIWNSGKADPTGNVGVNKYGVAYNTPAYVQRVQKYYEQTSGQQGTGAPVTPLSTTGQQQPQQQSSGGIPVTSLQVPSGISTNMPTPTSQGPQGIVPAFEGEIGKSANMLGAVGNFFFPIVKDLYGDVAGTNKKTTTQQAGDALLSSLAFIPVLGEASDATRAAAEGGSLLAKAAALPTVVKGGVLGYLGGSAGNLAQGQGVGQALLPNATNILSMLAGGATPAVLSGISSALERTANVTPELKNALVNNGEKDTNLFKQYADISKARASDITAPSAQNHAADMLDKAAKMVSTKAKNAGVLVGAAQKAAENIPMGDVSHVVQDFQQQVADKYGIALSQAPDGSTIVSKVPGRISSISPADESRIADAYSKMTQLSGNSARAGVDAIKLLDNSISYAKNGQQYGQSFDPVEGLLFHARQGLDSVLRQSSPDIAAANDRFSSLSGLENEIRKMAGGEGQRGELMMRRIFSGDKGVDIAKLFQDIEKETGVNLVKHAVMAKAATDMFGSANDRTLFQKVIEGSGGNLHSGILNTILHLGGKAVRSTVGSPMRIGSNIVAREGKALPGLLTKGAIAATAKL